MSFRIVKRVANVLAIKDDSILPLFSTINGSITSTSREDKSDTFTIFIQNLGSSPNLDVGVKMSVTQTVLGKATKFRLLSKLLA